jgi:hypothetical protein
VPDANHYTIHKVVLAPTESQTVTCVGRVERWLTAQVQHGRFAVWYEVDLSRGGSTDAEFRIVGTGNPRPPLGGNYIATVPYDDFVFHVYEVGQKWTPGGER